MVQKHEILRETASQTAGPYVHIGLMPSHAGNHQSFETEIGVSPVTDAAKGKRIEITGKVLDGTGWPLRDAMIESWQADAAGRYLGDASADPGVTGLCRCAIDPESGTYTLRTIKPGAVAMPDGSMQSPHIALWIVARGINTGLLTRVYFEDADRDADPVLGRIEHRNRVDTLIATPQGDGRYQFDIRLQGLGETVFLDI
ncbi:protocatechuate 3,4-dioxygenase subunit alpha [Loktanella agnita]|uniref:protocatechuate 3,4-dioxygenase subunit alpha n=1 Tax=Loktanella agnita TaxID=287097 RepID=UPI003987AA37